MATTPEFKYAPMFQLGKDETEYYLLTKDYVSVSEFEGKPMLKIAPEGLTAMANAAFRDVSFPDSLSTCGCQVPGPALRRSPALTLDTQERHRHPNSAFWRHQGA